VAVGGETKYTCVDGPEFNGHEVDFDLLMSRLQAYIPEEQMAMNHSRGYVEVREAWKH
jgi:ferredoxin--NADP+ reductase